jgi:hypothetical protein
MNKRLLLALLITAGLLAGAAYQVTASAAPDSDKQNQQNKGNWSKGQGNKGPSGGSVKAPTGNAQKKITVEKKVIVKKPVEKKWVDKKPPAEKKWDGKKPEGKKPPVIIGDGDHKHRKWRPGLRYRWIVVPSIIFAEELDWCHYHLYPVPGIRFHRSVQCHHHVQWDDPSIRYVEGY